MSEKAKVILRRVPDYDSTLIRKVIREGIAELGLAGRVRGRITVKPNIVLAHPKLAPAAFTRAEFVDGLLGAIEDTAPETSRVVITEKTGAGIPTSRMFRRAGYYRLRKKHPVRVLPLEEDRKVRVPLRSGTVHSSIRTGRSIADRDLLVYAPKLKTNVLSQGMTAALKLNVGILCDRERMRDHNFKLAEKVADLLEVGFPDFIATDAIEIATGGNQMTQHGRHLGLVIMASNPVAHDAVCARILHLDPEKLDHVRLARERGYGPTSLDEIEISGDITLDEVRERTKGLETGFIHAADLKAPIKIICGEPYCHGGCHGVMLDWLYMIKDRKPKLWNSLPEWTLVIGKYAGDVRADKVMLVGSCTEVGGNLEARRKGRVRGCPPKHKDIVIWFLLKTGILNPMLRLDLIWDAYPCLFFTWCRRLVKGRF